MTKEVRINQDDGETRVIGIIEREAFIKHVKESKHLYRKLNAWGLDTEKFENEISEECDSIHVVDIENDTLYIAEPKDFQEHGEYLHHEPHREQVFLSLEHWSAIDINPDLQDEVVEYLKRVYKSNPKERIKDSFIEYKWKKEDYEVSAIKTVLKRLKQDERIDYDEDTGSYKFDKSFL